MLSAVAFVPSPPLLVPSLAGSAAAEVADLAEAVRIAGTFLRSHAPRWVAVGSADATADVDATARGTYAGFGVDCVVSLGPDATGEPDRAMPLAALTAGLVRGQVDPDASVPVRLVAASASPHSCADVGASWSEEGEWGLLVIGDGATTLTDKAPGAFDERAAALQNSIDDALATADVPALAALDADVCAELGVTGRAAWQVAAAVVGDAARPATQTLYRDAPFGVGYFVGTWSW